MATFFTDFSEYATGAQPSDWTVGWRSTNVTWTVEADAGATGGKLLRGVLAMSIGDYCSLLWDDIAGESDVEVLVKYRLDKNLANTRWVGGAALRAEPTDGAEDGYFGGLGYSGGQNNELRKYKAGTVSTLDQTAAAWSIDTWYWIRVRVSTDNIVKYRRWADGDAEPGTWIDQVDDSADAVAAGSAGVAAYSGSTTTHEWDVVGVGTGGDSAPSEGGGGGGGGGDASNNLLLLGVD